MNVYIDYFKALCSDNLYNKIDTGKLNVWNILNVDKGVLWGYTWGPDFLYKFEKIWSENCNFVDADFIPNQSIDYTKIITNGINEDCLSNELITKINNQNVLWLDGDKIINETITNEKIISINWDKIVYNTINFITEQNNPILYA
jgi:hypothetical protein